MSKSTKRNYKSYIFYLLLFSFLINCRQSDKNSTEKSLTEALVLFSYLNWLNETSFRSIEIVNLENREVYNPRIMLPQDRNLVFFEANKLNNSLIFLSGGSGYDGTLEKTSLFDYGSNKISSGPNMINKRIFHTVVSNDNENYYIIGGKNQGNLNDSNLEIERYNATSNEIKVVGNLLYSRYGHKSIFINNTEILIIGGRKTNQSEYVLPMEIFNIVSGTSVVAGSLNEGRELFSIADYDNKVFVIGGGRLTSESSESVISIDLIEEIDKSNLNNNANAFGNLPIGVYGSSTFFKVNELYMFGGITSKGKFIYDTQIINFQSNSIKRFEENLKSSSGSCIMENGENIFIGYGPDKNRQMQRSIYQYNKTSNQVELILNGLIDRQYQNCIKLDNSRFAIIGRITPR